MANPINFSVAAAQRSGSFQTTVMTYPGGYSEMSWQLVGMGTGAGSDYENTNNKFTATVYYTTDGSTPTNQSPQYDQSTWVGGPATSKDGTIVDPPPLLGIGLGNLPTGCKVMIEIDLGGTLTIGIGSGVIQ